MITAARVRSLHRWLSGIFTLCVVINLALIPLGDDQVGMVVGGLTAFPLIALMATGLYLLALPYLRSR